MHTYHHLHNLFVCLLLTERTPSIEHESRHLYKMFQLHLWPLSTKNNKKTFNIYVYISQGSPFTPLTMNSQTLGQFNSGMDG